MKLRNRCSWLVLAALPLAAQAAEGLSAPSAESIWPQWQARLALQTSALQAPSPWSLLDSAGQQRAAQGAALLGDYYFALPGLGYFRASGGLMFGATGGAPSGATGASHWGLSVQNLGGTPLTGAETPGTVPYLGLGFTSAAWRKAWTLSADVGWVAEQPSALGGVGRAMQGHLGWETALRDVRLTPVVQLGVRLAF